MIALVDTHCHLDLFKGIKERVADEDSLGIKTITVTNASFFFKANVDLFSPCTNIRVALGFHPQLVGQYKDDLAKFKGFLDQTRYIGEIGLDGSKAYLSTYSDQLKVFKAILSVLSKSNDKVITVHSRGAEKETIDLLKEYLDGTNNKVILHWYSGSIAEATKAVGYGFYFSINHKMMQNEKSRKLLEILPVSRILTETDAPFTFGTGVQTRLQSLESTIKSLSDQKGAVPEKIRATIYENFRTLLV
ncbi:Qat anti-phage system TatD family nuclease QatD [Longitalea luteola]|uniref:Qat anti-phage system TatD family nuclease QatD n=1 Tax=Longitalea luteola TaxID=2812563 RepID=UPI001A96DE21|nr:Qat anti-phage system TatD family nuclease QatD [Longitalea luteola]